MSSDYKDIEQLFSDKLQNFEVTPPESVWKNIQQKKRKGVIFYFKNYLKVAVLLLLVTSGVGSYLWFKNSKTPITQVSGIQENKESGLNDHTKIQQNDVNNNAVSETDDFSKNINTESDKNFINQKSITKINTLKEKSGKNSYSPNVPKSAETFIPFAYDNIDLVAKSEIKLKYLVYPSLMQFVYTNKKIGRKPYVSKDKEKDDPVLASRYSMEILGGPSYASKRLSGDDHMLRKESEIATMSIQTGLKLNYHFNPKFNLQTGVIVENRNEKINYTHSTIQQKLIQTPKQVTVYHPVLPPKTITIIDSTYSEEVTNQKFNSTNKYTTLSVPLVLGYKFALGKAQYRFSAGTLINVHSSHSSSVLERSGNEIILSPYKENSKVKASLYSAFALQLPLSPTCDFITELSYYNNLKNRLSSETSVQQINYGFNLSIGASFYLKK